MTSYRPLLTYFMMSGIWFPCLKTPSLKSNMTLLIKNKETLIFTTHKRLKTGRGQKGCFHRNFKWRQVNICYLGSELTIPGPNFVSTNKFDGILLLTIWFLNISPYHSQGRSQDFARGGALGRAERGRLTFWPFFAACQAHREKI